MNPYQHMLSVLRRYHACGAEGERLGNELLNSGYNVTRNFLRIGVGLRWIIEKVSYSRSYDYFAEEMKHRVSGLAARPGFHYLLPDRTVDLARQIELERESGSAWRCVSLRVSRLF